MNNTNSDGLYGSFPYGSSEAQEPTNTTVTILYDDSSPKEFVCSLEYIRYLLGMVYSVYRAYKDSLGYVYYGNKMPLSLLMEEPKYRIERAVDMIKYAKDKVEVIFSGTGVTYENIKALAEAIKEAKHPVTLDLRRNNIGPAGAKEIAAAIAGARVPVKLNLYFNNIGPAGAKAIAAAIARASVSVTLDLCGNNIGYEGVKSLAGAITVASVPVTLDLRSNSIGGEGAKALAEAIKEAKHPVTLDLGYNKIGDAGAKAIAAAIAGASVPVSLDLNDNNIGPEGAQAIAGAIKAAKHPVTLDLTSNNIETEGAKAIAAAIAGARVPVKLNLRSIGSNHLRGSTNSAACGGCYIFYSSLDYRSEELELARRINKIRCEYHPANAIKKFLSTVPCDGNLISAIANYKVPEASKEEIDKYTDGSMAFNAIVSKEQASKILAMALFCDTEGDFKYIPLEVREFILSKIEDGEYLEKLVLKVYKEIKDANSNATAVGEGSDSKEKTEVATTDDDNAPDSGAEKNSDGEASDSPSSDFSEARESSNTTDSIFYSDSPKELILSLIEELQDAEDKSAKEYRESIEEVESREEAIASYDFGEFAELEPPKKDVETQGVLSDMDIVTFR